VNFSYHKHQKQLIQNEAIMKDYQNRIIEEKSELDEKAKKLSDFIGNNPLFDNIAPEEQELMKEQCETMWEYSEILGKRIAGFTKA